ncbi:MAG: hypothetical protein GXO00_01610, partial [Candidatus Diapherotrites archaeon]|nr:hypothetical protein [Candidatus Diapherotrites archaeon]
MGLLDKLKNVFKKEEKGQSIVPVFKKKEEPSLHIEEIDLRRGTPSQKPQKPVKKTEEAMKEVDEKKRFVEVVRILREAAGLPPVEEAFKERTPP